MQYTIRGNVVFSFWIKPSRVDVSETFSADQLWFRILSGLFQRCSLPENLWTALIQLWTALKTEIFRAKNQRWNSAVSALFQRWFSLKQRWFRAEQRWFRAEQRWFRAEQRWFRAEQRWFRAEQRWFPQTALMGADFPIIQNENYWSLFYVFQNFAKYLNFEAHNSGFLPSLRKEVRNKNLRLYFRTGQRYNKYLNFWVYFYCSSIKTDMVQLFKTIFAFIGVKFQDYSKKFESLLSICRIFTFSLI